MFLYINNMNKKLLFLILFCAGVCLPFLVAAEYAPQAMITFTFDDGAKRIYENAAPLFEAHNMPAVLYGETGPLNSGEDWVMTWDQVRDLQNRLGWEIGSHTITHPDLTLVSDQQLEQELLGSKQDFAEQGISTKSFATPMGRYDNRVLKAISKHYESHRAAWGGFNVWPYNNYEIISLEIKHTTSPEEVMGWIDQAKANNYWLVLLLHDVVDGTAQEYEYNKYNLKKIVDYVAASSVEVTTITEGLELSRQINLVSNPSFEVMQNGFANTWARTDTANVTVDQNYNGNAPDSRNSLKIIAGANQREAVSGFIPVENVDYILKMFQNGQNLTGGWAVWVNEYGSNSNEDWLSGQWLGGNYQPFFGTRYYSYTPTSSSVSKIKLHIYTETGSAGILYVDSVSLVKLGVATPPPPPPPPVSDNLLLNPSFENLDASGFANGWTNNNASAVTIDKNNNGSGEFSTNSLKITGSTTQNIAFSSMVEIDDTTATYEISYYARTDNWQSGGIAIWVSEYDASKGWLGGQWLGGVYEPVNGVLTYSFVASNYYTRYIDLHLFTETNSQMTLYIDDISVLKK